LYHVFKEEELIMKIIAALLIPIMTLTACGGGKGMGRGQVPFTTTWEVTVEQPTVEFLTFPGSYDHYDYNVEWGDGKHSDGVKGDTKHTYENPGTYQILITGVLPWVRLCSNSRQKRFPQKLISVDEWGDVEFNDVKHMFNSCYELETVDKNMNFPKVQGMGSMFANAKKLNSPMVINVPECDDFGFMLFGAENFNSPVTLIAPKVQHALHFLKGADKFNSKLILRIPEDIYMDGALEEATLFDRDKNLLRINSASRKSPSAMY